MKSTILLCLLLSTAAAAHAQAPPSRAEAAEELLKKFRQADADGDGMISTEEAKTIPLSMRLFDVADADRDGKLSQAELRAGLQKVLARQDRPSRPLPSPPAGVEQAVQTLSIDGRERSFIVQVPKGGKGNLPVVFIFHGGGGRAENMLGSANFGPLVARESFLAVYPSAWKGNWNDGRHGARIASQQEGVDDVKFIRAIVEEVAKRHPVDRSRIFATGGSNGGIFCHYLAAKAADVFAAIAPIIGGLGEPVAADFQPSHPISLLIIQGDADPLVPIGGGPIGRSDRRGRIISTEETLKLYLKHNGINGTPTEELLPDVDPNDGCRTRVRRWPPGKDGVKVEYWLIQGGGHTLPGRNLPKSQIAEELIGHTSRDFDFREVVWEFFKSCPPRAVEKR